MQQMSQGLQPPVAGTLRMSPSPGFRTIVVGAGAVCGLAVAFVIGAGDQYIGPLIGLVLLTFAAYRPREGAILGVLLGLLQYGPTKALVILPHSFVIVDDLLIVGVGVRWSLDTLLKGVGGPVWVMSWLCAWMLLGLFSAVANGTDLVTMLLSYRMLFLPAILYLASARYGGERRYARWLVGVVIGVCILQSVVAVAQALQAGRVGDTSFGLLGPGGANALGYLVLMGTALIVAGEGRPLARFAGVALGLVAIVCSASRAVLFIAPIGLLLTQSGRLRKPMRIVLVVGLAAAAAGFTLIAFGPSTTGAWARLSPSVLLQAQSDPDGGGRLIYVKGLPTVLGSDLLLWAAGLGPGQYTSVTAQKDPPPALLKVRVKKVHSSGFAYPDSELTTVMGEYGVLGLVCFVALLSRPLWLWWRPSLRRLRRGRGVLAQVTRAAPTLVLVAVVASLATNFFENGILSYPWWALVGLLEAARVREEGA